MDISFALQDPTDPAATYLYESIIAATDGANAWRGMYAFASRNGVDNLLLDPAVVSFLKAGGAADFVIGMDAVTNRQCLERLQHFEKLHATFKPRVFWNPIRGLFHPKLSHFSYPDGRQTLIVGSGNLTPGGLRTNFEGYTVVSSQPGEAIDLASLNGFFARHDLALRKIDDAALDEAAKNVIQLKKHPKAAKPPLFIVSKTPVSAAAPVPAVGTGRVLVAQVPGAGTRWQQIHLNQLIISTFFRVSDTKTQRVFLNPIDSAGNRSEVEVRPVVYSSANKNYKIEISQGKGLAYPYGNPPILIFIERQVRTFDYSLLMPGDPGYVPMLNVTKTHTTIGRGLPRVIISTADLKAAWPTSPLLNVKAAPTLTDI